MLYVCDNWQNKYLLTYLNPKLNRKNALKRETCQTSLCNSSEPQPDPAPRGAYRGRAPPNDFLCPPNENCVPPSEDSTRKKLTGLGLLGCKSRPKLLYVRNLHDINGMKTFFFWRSPDLGRKNRLNF